MPEPPLTVSALHQLQPNCTALHPERPRIDWCCRCSATGLAAASLHPVRCASLCATHRASMLRVQGDAAARAVGRVGALECLTAPQVRSLATNGRLAAPRQRSVSVTPTTTSGVRIATGGVVCVITRLQGVERIPRPRYSGTVTATHSSVVRSSRTDAGPQRSYPARSSARPTGRGGASSPAGVAKATFGEGTSIAASAGGRRQDFCGASRPPACVAIPLCRFQAMSNPSARTGRMIMVQNAFRSLL